MVKNLPADVGNARGEGSIPGSRKSPGEGNGNPLHCSCLGDSIDRGARLDTAHGSQSQTRLSVHMHTHTHTHLCPNNALLTLIQRNENLCSFKNLYMFIAALFTIGQTGNDTDVPQQVNG